MRLTNLHFCFQTIINQHNHSDLVTIHKSYPRVAFINYDSLINIGTQKHLLVIQYNHLYIFFFKFFSRYGNSVTAWVVLSSSQAVMQLNVFGGGVGGEVQFAFSQFGSPAKRILFFFFKMLLTTLKNFFTMKQTSPLVQEYVYSPQSWS